jgi:hypothetical protein
VEATTSCFNITNVGIEDVTENHSLVVYPNPTATSFTIESATAEVKTIRIYDALGKLIYELENSEEKTIIDASSWATGIYHIEVKSLHHTYQQKLVKN